LDNSKDIQTIKYLCHLSTQVFLSKEMEEETRENQILPRKTGIEMEMMNVGIRWMCD